MAKTTVGQYEYEIQLLDLFEHHDFAQRYTTLLASGAKSPEIAEKIKQAQNLEADDPQKKAINDEVGMACLMNMTKEAQKEISQMKMLALTEGQCWCKRVGEPDTHRKPIYSKEAFTKHFREAANPKEMVAVLEWALQENVKDFLATGE